VVVNVKNDELIILINVNGGLTFDETMNRLRKTRKCTDQMRGEKEKRVILLCIYISFDGPNEQ
jgi:hypothetical protein